MPVARKQSKLDRMLTPVTQDDLHEWNRRLDAVIDKFADATANLSISIAKHAQRLEYGDKMIDAIQADSRRLEEKLDANQKEYVKRLDAQTATVKLHFDETVKPLQTKVNSLARWRTWVMGGIAFLTAAAGVIAFIHELVK